MLKGMKHRLTFLAVVFAFGLVPSAHAQDSTTGGGANVRLENIRAQVDELQEKARQRHTQLMMIARALSSQNLARLDVDLSNDTSTAFKLSSAKVALDGVVQYERHDNLGDEKKLPVFTGAVAPGAHTVTVEIVLQGNGYGVFTYLRGYKVTLTSTHTFVATEAKPSHVTAAAYELTDVTLPFERRPQIAWR
jgi:hypothetical protein